MTPLLTLQGSDLEGYAKLWVAVLETPKPPCEVHQCQFRAKCSSDKLACSTFARYVRHGTVVEPTGLPSRNRYKLIHGGA